MENMEIKTFKSRMVLAVCSAGSDRSEYIADELNKRGYVASHGGTRPNHNYVTEDDLVGIGSIIFASQAERGEFKQNKRLNKVLKRNNVQLYVMNITESEKERAIQSKKEDELKKQISQELDALGFTDLKKYPQNNRK